MQEELTVGRGDPVYLAHSYLTKVPVTAIIPFVEKYTKPGDVVLDPFAGSGMTGVACMVRGRNCELSDISVLGHHIGSNYTTLVDPEKLRGLANKVVNQTRKLVGDVYSRDYESPSGKILESEVVKTVWSVVVQCATCGAHVNYYEALETANWKKPNMACYVCGSTITSRMKRINEVPVLDYLDVPGEKKQVEARPTAKTIITTPQSLGIPSPNVSIGNEREMAKASALEHNARTHVSDFYSPANWLVLSVLREQIRQISPAELREKLLFAFTAILTRASKRYQWSRKRPLNAANQNYYVAPVFYEWNVYDLFLRKIDAIIRSDDWIRAQGSTLELGGSSVETGRAHYDICSADSLELENDSVDYVFTDPPFGSNLFYADMAIFQEAWLDDFTDEIEEAVVDRSASGKRDALRYERILTDSLKECVRVLIPGGRISIVFGNSSGRMWSLLQRCIINSGLEIIPEEIVILNKGQRSLKGLASGFEHVATLDLILTLRERSGDTPELRIPEKAELERASKTIRSDLDGKTASHGYLSLLRFGLKMGWDLAGFDLKVVTNQLVADGWDIDERTGKLSSPEGF